jgi:hypothetical protein
MSILFPAGCISLPPSAVASSAASVSPCGKASLTASSAGVLLRAGIIPALSAKLVASDAYFSKLLDPVSASGLVSLKSVGSSSDPSGAFSSGMPSALSAA